MTPVFDADNRAVAFFDGTWVFDLNNDWIAFHDNGQIFASGGAWLGRCITARSWIATDNRWRGWSERSRRPA